MPDIPISAFAFEQFLKQEKIKGSRCPKCQRLYVPPRPICTTCYCTELEWVQVKGTGALKAFAVIHVAPPAMVRRGYDRNHPYCSGVVELDEGERVVARIEGIDPTKPEGLQVGMPMIASFLHVKEGDVETTVLAFKPI